MYYLLAVTLFLPLMFGDGATHYRQVVFIGNSLTLHSPNPSIGWTGFWGMAASQPDKDYVHRVQLGMAAKQGDVPEIKIISDDVPFPATDVYTQTVKFNSDLIIVEMGDNAANDATQADYNAAYAPILQAAQDTDARIILLGTWGGAPTREEPITKIADAHNVEYVKLADLHTAENEASAEHLCSNAPVCWHPGDVGMQAIANRILSKIYGERTGFAIGNKKTAD